MLISNLPKYYDGCYTEKHVAELLVPFGFCHKDDSIYVVPQAQLVGTVLHSCGL